MASLVASAAPPLNLPAAVGALRPVTVHLFTVGWITQMIFGVAVWMFPRASRERPRGRVGLALATYGLLNAGLVLRVVAEPFHTLRPGPLTGWPLAVSAALQVAAATLFAAYIWGRVKER